MSIAENFAALDRKSAARPLRKNVSSTVFLCSIVAALEGVVVALAFFATVLVYHYFVISGAHTGLNWNLYIVFTTLLGVLYAGFSAIAATRFFDGKRHDATSLSRTLLDWTITFACLLMVAFLSGTIGDLSRVSLTSAYLLSIPLTIGIRGAVHKHLAKRISGGELNFQKIAVIGDHTDVLSFLLTGDLWKHGQSIAGTLYLQNIGSNTTLTKPEITSFAADAARKGVEYVVIASDVSRIKEINTIVHELKRFSLNVVYALAHEGQALNFLDVVPIGPNNTLRVQRKPMSGTSVFLKRSMDVMGSGLGLLMLSPLFALVAVLIKLDSAGPVIYKQTRRGFNGEVFSIFKFRSMKVMEAGEAMRQAQRNDNRITRIGRFLRASSIDELPQLLNVFFGEMSLIGPRPHAISHDDELSLQMADYAHRQRIKPGITGWAQVNGFRGETVTLEQMQGRTLHDLHYIDKWSLALDCWILLLTVFSPTTRRDVF